MASDFENHWHATGYRLMVGPIPASVLLPVPVLPFWHPIWFCVLCVIWMGLIYWLSRKGLGLGGLVLLLRRWLQGSKLTPRLRRHTR